MRATMMDTPLTISAILRYGTSAYGEREVVTATPDGVRRRTYREIGARSARLANALRSLGQIPDLDVGLLGIGYSPDRAGRRIRDLPADFGD